MWGFNQLHFNSLNEQTTDYIWIFFKATSRQLRMRGRETCAGCLLHNLICKWCACVLPSVLSVNDGDTVTKANRKEERLQETRGIMRSNLFPHKPPKKGRDCLYLMIIINSFSTVDTTILSLSLSLFIGYASEFISLLHWSLSNLFKASIFSREGERERKE